MQMSERNCNLAMKNTIIILIKLNKLYLKQEKGKLFSFKVPTATTCYIISGF